MAAAPNPALANMANAILYLVFIDSSSLSLFAWQRTYTTSSALPCHLRMRYRCVMRPPMALGCQWKKRRLRHVAAFWQILRQAGRLTVGRLYTVLGTVSPSIGFGPGLVSRASPGRTACAIVLAMKQDSLRSVASPANLSQCNNWRPSAPQQNAAYSITSSARARKFSGKVMPVAFAVLRLTTSL